MVTARRLILIGWGLLLAGLAALTLWVWAVSVDLGGRFGGMPGLDKLFNPKSELATEVYSADGVLIGKYFRENRSLVNFEQLSPQTVRALLATEDIRFEDHSGLDFVGLAAVPFYLVRGERRGSSTLTQQLAKNLFNTRSEAYQGAWSHLPLIGIASIKTKEWLTALQLERGYTKREILTMYLNTVDFGANAYGIRTAAETYFGRRPSQLTAAESAVLVGLLKAPTFYSPIINPQNSLARRNTVLGQMRKYKLIEPDAYDRERERPLDMSRYRVESHNLGIAPYFRAELRKDLIAFCRARGLDLYADGLRVYTTIDSRLQAHAEAAMARHMAKLQQDFFTYWRGRNPWADENGKAIPGFIGQAIRRTPTFRDYAERYGRADSAMARMLKPVPTTLFAWDGEFTTRCSPVDSMRYAKHYLHAGLMSVAPKTGEIKAWVGGINFRHFKYDHVRQGRRQPGSAFKPFVYCAALDNGLHPCYELLDGPVSIELETGTRWEPKNSDGKFSGERMSLRKALAQSINSVAAQLIQRVGVGTVIEYARKLGITSPLDPVPALALGSSDVSVYEMVGAYATFVNQGTWTKPFYISRIEDKNGVVLQRFVPERREAISPQLAFTMVHMLRGATQERNGTALGLYRLGSTLQGNEVAGKTGTTSNYSDGWFMGMTRDLVTGIWVGGDDRSIHFRSFQQGQGSRMAMPIWSYLMDAAYADPRTGIRKGPFERPENFSQILDCRQWSRPMSDTAGPGQILERERELF